MKKTARLLLDKAVDSLILGIIRDSRAKQTIGFDTCVRRALSDEKVKFLNDERALTLQMLNSLRDAAQHYLVEVSEPQLYLHAQAALTLFRDVLHDVFDKELRTHLPERVLPISTTPPKDLAGLFAHEVEEVKKLLAPRHRRATEAAARMRALAIVDGAVLGENLQPGDGDLRRLMDEVRASTPWTDIFPGVAQLNLKAEGEGPSLNLRLTKKEGVPVVMVPEGTPGAAAVALKRVDEWGYYNLTRTQLAQKVGLTGPKTTAVVRFLKLQDDTECFKRAKIQGVTHEGYSQKAISKIKEALAVNSIEDIWRTHAPCRVRK